MHGNFPSCKAMACRINNHHTCTSRFLALIILALLLAHPSIAASWTNRSTPGGGSGGSLQVPARCRPEHAAALLHLKRSSFTFTASSYTRLGSWIEGTDCCRWEGVACDRVFGGVTGLDLSNLSLGINGSGLHPALFSLTSLKHLVLRGNDFCGSQLPASGFERLTRLEDLSLYWCNISGPIPPSFAGLRSLKTIDLSYNKFSGSTFPLWITHLKQLKVLDFEGMGLYGTIPISIGNLSLLTELNLSGNSFSGGLPSSVSNLTYLSRLQCAASGLSGRVPSLKNLSRLEFLDLSFNNFQGSTFPLCITHLKELEVLDFEEMGLYGSIPNSIGNLSLLTELYLSGNSFSGGLPSSLSNLTYLSQLGCSRSGLYGGVPSLQNLSTLQLIDLSSNNLEGNIPLSDGNLLQWVDMSHNSFTGSIQASIFTQPALKYLDLSSNRLSGHIEEFQNPSAVALHYISLSNNKLTGAIPTSFSRLRALIALKLDRNNFTGTLDLYPYLMLQNLSTISASHNPLLSVPGYDGDASKYSSSIWALTLASCGLTTVPSVIRYLTGLKYLDLSNNSIRGKIPGWIWRNMSSLSLQQNLFTKVGQLPSYLSIGSINLSSNKLRGSVPFPFAADLLDYSNNKFSSIRSVDFVRLYRTAEQIYLANNTLRGPIPYAKCHYDDASLEILDLSGNNLSGPVPPYLLGCGTALKVLNLRGNHLNGTWPDKMGESCSLVVVDLNGNQIHGLLPRSLASCNSLRHLDVGRNKFVDVFPSWLGNLTDLWLLVLRSNQFFGPLTMPGGNNKHSVANGFFSSLQIVDLAGNRFNGALPSEFFNVLKSMIRPQMNPDKIYMENYYSDYGDDYYADYNHDMHPRDYMLLNRGPGPVMEVNVGGSYHDFTLDVPVKFQVSMKHLYLSVNEIIYDLVVIDLSDNRFSGCIPKTIGNLTALHVLNLSHNTLSGAIPAEFGRLSNIESLDLSWNNLTGSIPQAMASLTNLEVLNLSYNDLSGKIPTGKQFNTFTNSSYQGGNQGLYGCPLPIRCNMRQPAPAAIAPAPPASVSAINQSFEAVILWLFVGSGYGIGIAVSIVLQMACCGRYMNDRLEKIASCIA